MKKVTRDYALGMTQEKEHKCKYEKAAHRHVECVVNGLGGGVAGAGQVVHDGLEHRDQDPRHPTWPVRPSASLGHVLHSHLVFS